MLYILFYFVLFCVQIWIENNHLPFYGMLKRWTVLMDTSDILESPLAAKREIWNTNFGFLCTKQMSSMLEEL